MTLSPCYKLPAVQQQRHQVAHLFPYPQCVELIKSKFYIQLSDVYTCTYKDEFCSGVTSAGVKVTGVTVTDCADVTPPSVVECEIKCQSRSPLTR